MSYGKAALDFKRVAAALLRQARSTCDHLLPGGTVAGREYRAPRRAAGGVGDSLSVNLRNGRWLHGAAGVSGGDLVALWAYVHGLSQSAARDEAAAWLGLSDAPTRPSAPKRRAAPKVPAPAAPDLPAKGKSNAVARLLAECIPLAGSHAEAYLRARGLSVPDGSPLLFHGGIRHRESWRLLPAMVARIDGPDGEMTGAQIAFLEPAAPTKAAVDPARKMRGAVAGGAVKLTPAGPTLAVAEGIETALAVWTATGMPTWAALSTSGLQRLELPDDVEAVVIVADNDANGAGFRAAEAAAARWMGEGRSVRIALPGAPQDGQKSLDANDVLRDGGTEAVRALIDGAAEWIAPAQDGAAGWLPPPLPARVKDSIPPYFRSNPLDAETASARLRELVDGCLADALAFRVVAMAVAQAESAAKAAALADNPDLDPALNYGFDPADRGSDLARAHRRLVLGAKKAARATILADRGLDRMPRAPRVQIAAAAGLGKTAAIIDALARSEAGRAAVVHFFVPSLALADGVAERCRAAGLTARVIRGRAAKAPNGEPMCMKARLAEKAGKLGLNVRKSLCESGPLRCQFIDRCRYMAQTADVDPSTGCVFVLAHEYMALPRQDGVPAADLVVVDESPIATFLAHRDLDPSILGDASLLPGSVAKAADFVETCRRVREALLCGEPVRQAMDRFGVTRADIVAAAAVAAEAEVDGGGITPRTSEAEGLRILDRARLTVRTIDRLLSRLAAELRLQRDILHGVEVRTVTAEHPDTGEPMQARRIVVHWRRHSHIDPKTPLLVIDADADEEIGAQLWGHDLRHYALPVERCAVVTQIADLTFSKSSLLGIRPDDPDAPADATAAARLDKVRRLVAALVARHGAGRVLVVANRPVRCALTGEAERDKLPPGVEWRGATIGHFGSIRGIDDWRDHACAVIIGREQLPPTKAEAMARALYCNDPDPLALPGDYELQNRGYTLRDGRHAGAAVPVHADWRVQRLHELKREREVAQAIDRLRLVHRAEPAEVFVLGSLPLDLTVDQLVGFDELIRATEIRAAVTRHGVLPLSPAWLVAEEPALFAALNRADASGSERAVKRVLEEHGLTVAGAKSQSPNISLFWTLGLCSLMLYRLRSGGRERVALAVPGTHAWERLEAKLGQALRSMAETFAFAPRWREAWEHQPCAEPEIAGRAARADASRRSPAGGGLHILEKLPVETEILVNVPALVAKVARPVDVTPFAIFLPAGLRSEIVVQPPMRFAELAVWNSAGTIAGWHFGLPLPPQYEPVSREAG